MCQGAEIFGPDFQGLTESFRSLFNPKVAGPHQSEVSLTPLVKFTRGRGT